MNLTMQLTLDGLIRALRLKEHGLLEDHDEQRRQATMRNDKALSLLTLESRRLALEAGDEFGG